MNEAEQEKLYGLMEIADRQQAVAQTALEGMAAILGSFSQERERWMHGIGVLSEDIRGTVLKAASESMSGAAEAGASAVEAAAETLVGRLAEVSVQAGEAEASLRRVVGWASWRLLGACLATALGLVLVSWLAVSAAVWRDTSAIGAAEVRKAQLQAEIATLEETRDAWVKAGLLAKLEQCGPKKRPCVQVDDSAGHFGDHGDYRVLGGY